MPNKRTATRGPSKATLLLIALLALAAVGALAHYVQSGHDKVLKADYQAKSDGPEPKQAQQPRRQRQSESTQSSNAVTLFRPRWDNNDLQFDEDRVQIPDDEDPRIYAINQYLAISKAAPPEAKLDSITVKNGIADLYFNSSMPTSLGGDDEVMMLRGIERTLGQFPEIEKIRFYVGGQKLDTFGNVDLSGPQSVSRTDENLASSTQRPPP